MVALSVLAFVGISLATPPPDPDQVADLTYSRDVWHRESAQLEGTPWYAYYHVLAFGVELNLVQVRVVPRPAGGGGDLL